MIEEVEAVATQQLRDAVAAKVKAAEERREQCEAAVRDLEAQIASVQETLRAIEDAPEVTQNDLLERENARRKQRTLKASLAASRAAAQKAETDLAEVQLAADKLELQDLQEQVRKDVVSLGEYFLNLEQQVRQRLAAHRDLVAARRALGDAVRVGSGGAPGTHTGGTVFSTISEAEGELWDGIARALLTVREMGVKRQRAYLHGDRAEEDGK
ncbi:hypothetical protein A2cp1_3431 [Anaeromyxobacter dehalogenans 2CP-1]|uniref:Uncharacterized protein n=1 Tax=Anaeromyxobacter dehalogenans (strain ATCC BAA-258 / DSM 21875 / 2CP-1) TaxID=455488 RepID=B8JHP9_ANAD2|nr:hypothetical protein [Anaeromyxobacter dehalogenans]ACL66761.1 hypothetical protein A2cp1_3431 [Anaeromyxobacter dehalogenans 2CP-1]